MMTEDPGFNSPPCPPDPTTFECKCCGGLFDEGYLGDEYDNCERCVEEELVCKGCGDNCESLERRSDGYCDNCAEFMWDREQERASEGATGAATQFESKADMRARE